ncbi:hypothetical protein BU16DRAFT_528522 [Lophium mytilinum]|uniref:Uncharacterized protein n=1 Tax=Lophium mytilinum TaxID=390894 RepID=A0A6A6QLI7_9PEZI|nr:hypothetical protein BU16DRAFT_528522 [Lophium mytilinum]
MDLPRSTSPQPMVRVASHEGPIDLRHPTPDLQSLQGAYIGNVERLEERAERMSSTGSELGEEIRKLQLEQKLSDSRKSSLLSGGDDRVLPAARSRNASTSSYTNSIVDVNTTARWGGYSPGGFITSPIGSIRSGSWSQPSLQRQRSASRTSRLGNVIHPEDEENHHDQTVSPTMHNAVPRSASPKPSSRRESSFGQHYDQIAQEITNAFDYNPNKSPMSDSQHHSGYFQHDLPDRPPTAASTDTYHQARTLFQDFDGVHCSPVAEEFGANSQNNGSRNSSLLRSMPPPPQPGQPPPNDGMVFYPAPVPRMLNLPKRLSQLPAASVQAKRRTQLLQSLPPDARKSAIWLPDEARNSSDSADAAQNRKSVMNPRKSVSGLPAQLRASMFFDQVAEAQEFEVKGESAEETLDSILEASAHAPVGAFTDHPYAGRVGNEVYGKEDVRRSTISLLNQDKAEARKSRSSLNLLRTRRNSSGDGLNKLQKRNSTQDLNRLTVRNSSHMSIATGPLNDVDQSYHHQEDNEDEPGEHTPMRHSLNDDRLNDEREHSPEDLGEGEEEMPEEPQGPQFHGPPTTLLAELQMRKQLQKSRNVNNTNFSAGLHSTLLELDAVAQLEKKKRHNAKVTLAWEDPDARPAVEEDDDDEVPLGMLYPQRDGLINKGRDKPMAADWDRPLGLIAQRELEDNEPLSKRRNRLRGVDPRRVPSPVKRLGMSQHSPSMPMLPGQAATPPVEEEGEEETLAQRKRRLAERQVLDNAIGNVETRPISGDFASEMMSQFGGLNDAEKEAPPAVPVDEEEETLGQRRARLRLEAIARGENPDGATNALSRPPLRGSHSMADLLSAHPLGPNSARKVSNEALLSSLPAGSLLQQNEMKRTRQKADLMETNKRSTSYGLDKPLIGDLGNIQDPSLVAKPAPFKGGVYNNGIGGRGGAAATPQPALGNAHTNSGYYPMANMGMPTSMSMNFAQPGYFPQPSLMPQQMMGLNMGMQAQGFPQPGFGGYPQMSMQQMQQMSLAMQQPYDPAMDARQRDMIDRWRQSIMP